LGKFALAAHEAGELKRQIVDHRFGGIVVLLPRPMEFSVFEQTGRK